MKHKTFEEKVIAVMPPVTITPEQIAAIAAQVPGGLTINQIKSDTDLADAISKKHSNSNDHASGSDNQDLSNLVVKISDKSLVFDTEIAKIHSSGSDNQDLSGLQPKETGKGLYPDADSTKLAGIAPNANNYTHPANHAASVITQDSSNRFATDAEKTTWNSKEAGNSNIQTHVTAAHAPSDAVSLATVKADSAIADSLAKRHDGAAQDTAIAGKNLLRLFSNLTAAVVTSGTTEKILLQLAIPANRAVVGSTFRATILGNSSSTGTLIFKVREGVGGVITDAVAWTAITSAAQAANKRAGFDVLITVRSATTNYTDGIAYAGTLQLETVIAVPATSVIAISGIWYISLTVICSSGTFTAQVGSIEEIK